ncbi:MAG: hypothetical protein ACC742_13610 [Thermoanaerobaculales bacterium]
MFLIVCLAGLAVLRLTDRTLRPASLLGPLFLFSTLPYVRYATEIRNDSLAFTCVIVCVAILSEERFSPARRAAAAGLFFGMAVWSTQKLFIVGLPFVVYQPAL